MAYSVYLDFSLGWEELSIGGVSLVLDQTIQKTQTLHKELKPTSNSARFTLAGDATIINRILGYNLDIPAIITDDSNAWFTGFIRSTMSTSVKYGVEKVSLEIVDSSFRLKKKNDTYFLWEGYTLCDPVNKSTSIMHQLFYLAGFDDSELDFPTISKTIPVITDTGDQSNTIEKYVNQLCLEFGYVWNFDDGGFCNLEKVIITDETITSTIDINNDTGDMSGELTIEKRRKKKGGSRVTFRELEEVADAVVFSDTTGGSGSSLASIEVLGNYPEGSDDNTVYCDYRAPDGSPSGAELISAKNASLDWAQEVGGGLSVADFTPEATRAALHITGSGTITKLRIIADATLATDYIIKASLISTITEEEAEEITADYINSESDAETLANARRLFWEFSDIEYSCFSGLGSLGDIARLQEVSRTGIDMRVRIFRIDHLPSGKRKIYLEAVEEYTASAVNQGIKFSGASPESSQVVEIAVEAQEYADAIQTAVVSYVDSIALAIENAKQDAIVNGSTLIVNGYLNTDFIQAGAIVAGMIAANAITTTKIASGAVEADNIAAEAITATKLAADVITSTMIETAVLGASGAVVIGYYGTGSKDNPNEGDRRVFIDADEIGAEEYTGGKWTTVNGIKIGGTDSNGNFSPFISCRGVLNPTADEESQEYIPDDNFSYLDFENDFSDQNGVTGEYSAEAARLTSWSKFGSYSFGANSGYAATMCLPDVMALGDSVAFACYMSISDPDQYYSIAKATYAVDVYNYLTISLFYYVGGNSLRLSLIEKVGGTTLQEVNVDYDVSDPAAFATDDHFIGFVCDFENNTLSLIIDDIVTSISIDDITLTGDAYYSSGSTYPGASFPNNELVLYVYNESGRVNLMDDVCFSTNSVVDVDLLFQHFTHGVAWNPNATAKDLILKAAEGGEVKALSRLNATEGLIVSKGLTFPPFGEVGTFLIAGSDAYPTGWSEIGDEFDGDSLIVSTEHGTYGTALSARNINQTNINLSYSQSAGLTGTWRLLSRTHYAGNSSYIPVAMFMKVR